MERFIPDIEHERAFRDALGRFATGVTVVTAKGPEGPLGITANSFAALSLAPPLVLWSPARASTRFPIFRASERYAIHILGAGQSTVCRHFTKIGSFEGIEHSIDLDGVPHIPGCIARFDCRRTAVHEGGDHEIIVGEVLNAEWSEGDPLVFHGGRFLALA